MNKRGSYRDFQRYVAAWAGRLGLGDWRVETDQDLKERHKNGYVNFGTGNRQAMISWCPRVSPTMYGYLDAERTALHELLHLAISDLIVVTAARGSYDHADVRLEEHRLIEKILRIAPKMRIK